MTPQEVLDLLDAVIYGDLFDCAVTQDEIWRFSRLRTTPEAVAARLARPECAGILHEHQGYYCLRGREGLAADRAPRRAHARELRRRAGRVARWLQHVPFTRGVLLTGSVAADDAQPDADVDVLVIVAPGRLGLVFALLGPLSRLSSRKLFCPNYYLSEAHVALPRRGHYVAREIAQAVPLTPSARSVHAANAWIHEHLPNATPGEATLAPLPGGRSLQRGLERLLRGRLGERLEARARKLALTRLHHHHGLAGRPVPPEVVKRLEQEVELRFHESESLDSLDARYEARRGEVARMLQSTSSDAHV